MLEEIYFRYLNIPFTVLKFTKKDIKTRMESYLNFYQKYITLLLKDGIKANSIEDLCNELSVMLNLKYILVLNYVEHLNNLGGLKCVNGLYYLADDTYYQPSDKNPDILVANVQEGKDKLDFIYFVDAGKLISTNILEKANINIGSFSETSSIPSDLINDIKCLSDVGRSISMDSLNKLVSNSFIFNEDDLSHIEKAVIHLPIKVKFEYDRRMEKGVFVDCWINNDDEMVNKYISSDSIKLKAKSILKFDDKKPDYILLEEYLLNEKKRLEKIKNNEDAFSNLEKVEFENGNVIKSLNKEIEENNKIIKALKKEVAKLKNDTDVSKGKENEYIKELEKKEKDIDQYLLDLEKLKGKVKEVNKKNNKLKEDKKKYKNEIDNIKKSLESDRKTIINDEYDRKLEVYRLNISKIDPVKYFNLYEETNLVYSTMLSFYKKINNDSLNLKNEWFNLYNLYTIYFKVLICYLLGKDINEFGSVNSLINDITSTELGSKYGLKISSLRNLNQLEKIVDTGRHKFDSKSKVKENGKKYSKGNELFQEFIGSSADSRKNMLSSIIELFDKAKLKEEDYKILEDMLSNENIKSSI